MKIQRQAKRPGIILGTLMGLLLLAAIPSCKKDPVPSGPATPPASVPPPPVASMQVKDAASLAAVISIEGAQRKSGDIPAPAGNTFTKTLNIVTPQVILTSGNQFDFELQSDGAAKIIFIKIDGTDKYFQVTVDENGNFVQRRTGNTRIRQCCTGNCMTLPYNPSQGQISNTFSASATVQVFEPPLQAGVPDLSFLSDWRYWSQPKKITYKCFPTGTGDVFVTLTWNKQGDVDLWLREPNGNKIYYGDKISSNGGELDYDNMSGYGPENIFYEQAAPAGNYEVWVHYYSEYQGPTDWVVTVKNGSALSTERGTLVNDDDSVLVKTFTR